VDARSGLREDTPIETTFRSEGSSSSAQAAGIVIELQCRQVTLRYIRWARCGLAHRRAAPHDLTQKMAQRSLTREQRRTTRRLAFLCLPLQNYMNGIWGDTATLHPWQGGRRGDTNTTRRLLPRERSPLSQGEADLCRVSGLRIEGLNYGPRCAARRGGG
jgi:hypothetical protein